MYIVQIFIFRTTSSLQFSEGKMWSRAHQFVSKVPCVAYSSNLKVLPNPASPGNVANLLKRRPICQCYIVPFSTIASNKTLALNGKSTLVLYHPSTYQRREYKSDQDFGHKPRPEDPVLTIVYFFMGFTLLYIPMHE